MKTFNQFITDHNLQDRTCHVTDCYLAPITTARVIFCNGFSVFRVITADSVEEASEIAIAAEKETNFSTNRNAQKSIFVCVRFKDTNHYNIILEDD